MLAPVVPDGGFPAVDGAAEVAEVAAAPVPTGGAELPCPEQAAAATLANATNPAAPTTAPMSTASAGRTRSRKVVPSHATPWVPCRGTVLDSGYSASTSPDLAMR